MFSGLHPVLKIVAAVLAIVGVLAIIAGIMYVALQAHSLPSFFPGHVNGVKHPHDHLHAKKHGYAALALGVVLLVAAVAVPLTARRTQRAHT